MTPAIIGAKLDDDVLELIITDDCDVEAIGVDFIVVVVDKIAIHCA